MSGHIQIEVKTIMTTITISGMIGKVSLHVHFSEKGRSVHFPQQPSKAAKHTDLTTGNSHRGADCRLTEDAEKLAFCLL